MNSNSSLLTTVTPPCYPTNFVAMYPNTPGDDELVHGILSFDLSAFDAAYGKYGNMLFGFLVQALQNKQIAAQILQEVFIELPFTLQQYHPQQLRLSAFLLQQTRKKIRAWRKQQPLADSVLPVLFATHPVHAYFSREEEELFNLCYYHGFTLEDVAAYKGWRLEEARQRCYQVLLKFRHQYPAIGGGDVQES